MKKICLLLILALLLGCFTGCAGNPVGEWFSGIFSTGEEPEAPAEDEAEEEEEEAPGPVAPVTETKNELEEFGLAYQVSYGIHPYQCLSLNNRAILSFLYEPLFVVTSDFMAQPYLAESFYVSDSGLQTTITLKPGLTFSDGTALTAADVAYSIESCKDSAYYGNRLNGITGMETPDDRTIVLTTRTAYGDLPLLLDIPIIKSGTSDTAIPTGSGPYRYAGSTLLRRNTNWWQDTAPLVDFDTINLIQTNSSADIRDQFEYENVNLVLSDPNSSAHVNFHNDYELWMGSTTILQYIGYNLGSNVFSNYGLRGAVTFAIDRESIVTDNGFALAATLPASPLSEIYDIKLANSYAYSLDKYYARLESASVEDMDSDGILDLYVTSLGYAIPVDGTMIVCSSSYQRVQAATEVVKALNALGFDLTLKSMDYAEYSEALRYGNYDLYYGEVRLSSNFDLSPFFRYTGSLCYGQLGDGTMENLCNRALLNSGNTYDLFKRVCDRGYITPILFKSYAIYTTRGAVAEPAQYLDWFLPPMQEMEEEP